MRDMNKALQKSQEPKSTGELAMVWKSHVSTVYMDLMFMLTKLRSWLSLFLMMDIIICVIMTLLNNNWHLKNNGCGRWLFLEMNLVFIGVMAASCWSELRGCFFWEVYNVLVLC